MLHLSLGLRPLRRRRGQARRLRHIWFYYIAGYELPLNIRGTYDNQRCLFCHGPVKAYQEVPEHEKNAAAIATSGKSCVDGNCHVSPHPKSAARAESAHASWAPIAMSSRRRPRRRWLIVAGLLQVIAMLLVLGAFVRLTPLTMTFSVGGAGALLALACGIYVVTVALDLRTCDIL